MVSQVNNSNQQANVLTNSKQQQVDKQKNNAATQTAQAPSAKATSDSVSLTLTPQAKQLTALQEKAQQSAGFDSDKVAELKKAISEGKYQVDSEKLAKNLAEFEFNVYG
jgi:negative regulator of flagellin synthesis FlgM